jgi:hypothetical protein
MDRERSVPLDADRAFVDTMTRAGESLAVIGDYILCLDLSEAQREDLRQVAARSQQAALVPADIASGDVLAMNPLTSQPQRAEPR